MKRITTYILGLLAIIALVAFCIDHPEQLKLAVMAAMALPFLGIVIPEGEFQTKVLGGIEAQKKQAEVIDGEVKATRTKVDQLVGDYDRLSKETKGLFDDLSKLKKHANDSQGQFEETVKRMDQIQHSLHREARMAFGDPIRRIQADENLRLRFNAAVRLAISNNDGDMTRLVRSKFPSDFVKKALGEDSSPGSTIIDDALATEIYDTLAMYGIWNTFGVRRLSTKQTKYPVKTARPVANFVLTEAGTIADDTNKAGTSVTLEAEVIGVLLNVSLQLLQDAEVDITRDILDDFAEAFAYRLDWACTQADGGADATDGGMTGVFGGGGTAAAAAGTHSTVEATTLEDWTKCLLTVDPAVLSRQARWWMHPQILVRALSVKDSNGRSIFLPANEAPTVGGIGSILGYPVTPAHVCPTTNAATAKVAVFGDPAGQVVGIRTDYAFEASDQHRWNTYERSFRGVGRAGTKIRRALAYAVLTLTA